MASLDISSRQAAPSLSGEELPPVTVPPERKAGFLAARSSAVRPALIPSSLVTGPDGASMGTISASNRPASAAAAPRWWLASANAS
jgi:hypothetical protein